MSRFNFSSDIYVLCQASDCKTSELAEILEISAFSDISDVVSAIKHCHINQIEIDEEYLEDYQSVEAEWCFERAARDFLEELQGVA